ncbi:MBL fold metallo-hydrolase [Solibaculum mannosilyticum]|uniref:MBL fold metallo-hydrolase n=1 Tax=Solibaculum mannosilyticum TaxID=2780922 RepID=UPI0007A8260F|nr:putative metallo-hydrolase [Eubacteriaceae bacterium CHKCI005]
MKFLVLLPLSLAVLLLCSCQSTEQGAGASEIERIINTETSLTEDISQDTEMQSDEAYVEIEIFQEGGLGISYIVNSPKGILMIDSGFYNEELEEYLKANGGPDVLLITHGHYDHIGGIDNLKRTFPDTKIFINEKDQPLLEDAELNYSSSMSEPVTISSEVQSLDEGTYQLAGYQVEVISFGGHTAGSNFYYLPEENLLFTGDAILPESLGPVRATGSAEQMQESAHKLLERSFPDDMRVFCGHNGNTTFEKLLKNNSELMENE